MRRGPLLIPVGLAFSWCCLWIMAARPQPRPLQFPSLPGVAREALPRLYHEYSRRLAEEARTTETFAADEARIRHEIALAERLTAGQIEQIVVAYGKASDDYIRRVASDRAWRPGGRQWGYLLVASNGLTWIGLATLFWSSWAELWDCLQPRRVHWLLHYAGWHEVHESYPVYKNFLYTLALAAVVYGEWLAFDWWWDEGR